MTVKRAEFEYIKRLATIESDLPIGIDVLSALRRMEGTLNVCLGLDTENPDASIKEPMRTTMDLERERPEARWTETITAEDGIVLGKVLLYGNILVAEVSGKVRLDPEASPVQSFLIPKVLDAMWNKKHIDNYEFLRTEDGFLRGIQIDLGGEEGAERRIRELTGAIAWTLKRLNEKRPGAAGN